MTNNQINYWKVESDRQKWQNEVNVARMNAETQRNAQIEQARHNLIDEELRRAINDADRAYKEALVQIDSEYKQRMAATAEQSNRIQARNVEINRMLGESANRINQSKVKESVRHNLITETQQAFVNGSVMTLNRAKADEAKAGAAYKQQQANWYSYDKIMGTIDSGLGHIDKWLDTGVRLVDAVVPF